MYSQKLLELEFMIFHLLPFTIYHSLFTV